MLTYLQLIRRLEIPLSFRRELLKLLRLSVPEACVQLQEYTGCVLKFRKQHHAKSENYAGFSGDGNTTLFCKNAVRKDSATKRRRLPLTGISGKRILTAIQAQRTCRDIPARRSGVITEPF